MMSFEVAIRHSPDDASNPLHNPPQVKGASDYSSSFSWTWNKELWQKSHHWISEKNKGLDLTKHPALVFKTAY